MVDDGWELIKASARFCYLSESGVAWRGTWLRGDEHARTVQNFSNYINEWMLGLESLDKNMFEEYGMYWPDFF